MFRPDPDQEVLRKDLETVWHPMVQHRTLEQTPPLMVVSAKDSTIVDANGREYLDGLAGLYCVNVGYGRTSLVEAATKQMSELAYYPHTQANIPAALLAERLDKDLPDGDYHVYYSASGSEANEVAFKLARQYHKNRGKATKYKIMGRYYGYHGTTLGTLAAGGMSERRQKFEPLPQGFVHVAPPYCYRCPFGLSYPSCELACVKNMDFAIAAEGPDTMAGVVVEPIMSGVGVLVPPDEYLAEVQAVCRKHDLLLMVDEVINGFGRTGKMFAHQHYGIRPDMVEMAKGISSAYLPLAATAVADSVFAEFLGEPHEKKHAFQVNTYGGHPTACAVALANLDIITEEKLADRAAEIGGYLLDGLKELLALPAVGDVRGKGLLIGIELVTDQQSRAPASQALVAAVAGHCLQNGLIVGKSAGTVAHLGNTIILAPPLVLTRSEADQMIRTLREAIQANISI